MSPQRKLSAACLAISALAPLPAVARDETSAEMARRLSDPANHVAAAVALTAISEALLDMRIEPLRRAAAAMGGDLGEDLPSDARLRDLAGPEARALPGEIGRRVPEAMGAAAGVANAFEAMLPELRAMAERLKDAVPPR
jgi:hypothetical protein